MHSFFIKSVRNFIFIAFFFSCHSPKKQPLTIATASNMKVTMKALQTAFEEHTGIQTQLVVASSGKLTAQIKSGAPYDLFVSADIKFPTDLYNEGFATIRPYIYAYGTLILWTCKKNIHPSLELLTSTSIKHIAISNAKTAPYGVATEEVLEFYSLKPRITATFITGESVSQTNQFIQTKNVDIGFTCTSVLHTPHLINKGSWITIPKESYTPIAQGIIPLNTKKSSMKFFDFMQSTKAKNILKKYGYHII